MTTKEALHDFAEAFTRKERDGKEITILKPDAPEGYRDLMRELHEDALPNDDVYEEVRYVASRLTDYDNFEEAIDQMEADPYNGELLDWLYQNPSARGFMEEVINEGIFDPAGKHGYDFFQHVTAAQAHYRRWMGRKILSEFQRTPEEEGKQVG